MNGNYPKVSRIDWFRVIVDLEGKRWSLERIAAAVDRSKGWVSNLKNIPGTEPKFHDGLMLLGLWMHVTGKERSSVELAETERPGKGQERARIAQETPVARKFHLPQERHGQSQSERPDSGSAAERPGATFSRERDAVFAA